MSNWASYDSAAGSHDRIAVPNFFERPAHDLIARIHLKPADAILDVGTGSGVVALQAAAAAGPGAMIAGIDPSLEMLRMARKHGLRFLAVGAAPGLPFGDSTFDKAFASFVLSHVPCYETAMQDIARVLKSGGWFGATCWGPMESEVRALWQEIAERFVGKQVLAGAVKLALPWEDWFAEQDHLDQAFRAAGLGNVGVERLVYVFRINIGDFLAIREASGPARFMRHFLSREKWGRFKETGASEFYRRFRDPIDYSRDVLIAVGTRP